MTGAVRRERPLIRLVGGQIVVYALLAMGLQLIFVFTEYYRDDAELARLVVESEATRLAAGLVPTEGMLQYDLPEEANRYAGPRGAYLAKIRTASGTVLFSNCDQLCSQRLLPAELDPPDFWLRQLRPGKPLWVVGGRSFHMASGEHILVELAVLGDPQSVLWQVLGNEIVEHMAIPMALMLVFVLGATLLSVRRVLRPVAQAAAQADVIDPLDPSTRLRVEGMPREIAHLAAAVNRAIARIGELIRSQKLFTAAVAHEIRTPLAMMKLELGRIDHPRARKAESDLQSLAHFVDQVTSLAKLETADTGVRERIDPRVLGRSLVASMAPWIYDTRHRIGFVDLGGETFLAGAGLIEDAVRNLVENAARHTPAGTQISVEAGPGARIAVTDDAGAYRPVAPDEASGPGFARLGGGIGIGLEIVGRIAQMYGGRFAIETDPGRRTTAILMFSRCDGERSARDATEPGRS